MPTRNFLGVSGETTHWSERRESIGEKEFRKQAESERAIEANSEGKCVERR